MKILWAALLVLAIAGCTPTVDTSSPTATDSSMKAVLASVPDADRKEFESLLGSLIVNEGFRRKSMQEALAPMNGMDTAAALAYLRSEKEARLQEARKRKEEELAKLKAEAAEYQKELSKLESIRVGAVRVVKDDAHFGSMFHYRLAAKITNNLDVALSAVKVSIKLKGSGRAVPWYKGDAWFFIKGGIEPGETVEDEALEDGLIVLHNLMEEHDDAVLILSVVDATGADEESIIQAREPTDFEKERIESLEKELQQPI